VEKDNGIPSVDRRASGHENAADLSSVIHRMRSSQIEKKVPETRRCFVSQKMKENEPCPNPAPQFIKIN
jgi:hypothetical protein